MSFTEGWNLGEGVVDRGVDQYNKAKEFRARLTNLAAQKAERDATRAMLKQNYDSEAGSRAASARVNNAYADNLERGLKREGGDPNKPSGAGRGATLTEYQKGQLVAKHSKNYLAAKANDDQSGMAMYGKALADLGVDLPNVPAQHGWLYNHTVGAFGGESTPSPAGSEDLTPEQRAALGL